MSKSLQRILIVLGVICLLIALGITIFNMIDSERAGRKVGSVIDELVPSIDSKLQSTDSVPDYIAHPDMEMPTIEIEGQRYVGYIEIPDLNLRLPVAAGEFSIKKLQTSPALYTGSVYKGDMIIAAHNYVSHFGRLTRLSVGAPVKFIDADGNEFNYTVGWTETIYPSERDKLVEKSESWQLTLFTCTYGRQKRFTVRLIAEK